MASYMTGKNVERESAAIEELLGQGDWRGMVSAGERRLISACGVAGMAAVLCLAGEGCQVEVLARAHSQARDEDESRVVHYAAVSVDTGSRAFE
jgi:AmmeMemoRadiSam system protein B